MHENGRKGILLSALTTLAGFGSLLLARHPALFSLGAAVTGGIAAAMAAALWLQPLMFAPAGSPLPQPAAGGEREGQSEEGENESRPDGGENGSRPDGGENEEQSDGTAKES
jgi:uncharacterized membrane protein YdfJ with MMPL/SSD domain